MSEVWVRFAAFVGIFLIMASWELYAPKRRLVAKKNKRWFVNFALVIIDTIVVRAIYGAAAVGAAIDAGERQIGLLNDLNWPIWTEVVLAVLLLDLAIYAQHVASHKIPILWRLHKVHHSDRDMDVTTSVRFHPVEIALSMGLKIGLIYLFGFSPLGVLLFEIILNGMALFNHSNVRMPSTADRLLRLLFVTPDMHRIHHSVIVQETDSNYGFNLSFWDRLFRTYNSRPQKGHEDMGIGIERLQDDRPTKLTWTLWAPVKE